MNLSALSSLLICSKNCLKMLSSHHIKSISFRGVHFLLYRELCTTKEGEKQKSFSPPTSHILNHARSKKGYFPPPSSRPQFKIYYFNTSKESCLVFPSHETDSVCLPGDKGHHDDHTAHDENGPLYGGRYVLKLL